jgi:hypothetical protein
MAIEVTATRRMLIDVSDDELTALMALVCAGLVAIDRANMTFPDNDPRAAEHAGVPSPRAFALARAHGAHVHNAIMRVAP